jgi:hypothetical protein
VGCLSILKLFTPDKLKVASRDLTNLPLIYALAETKIPIILSTGMAGKKELDDALEVISKYHENISILHCVSQYPTRPENVNLKTIINALVGKEFEVKQIIAKEGAMAGLKHRWNNLSDTKKAIFIIIAIIYVIALAVGGSK